jgi:hypothetical protein
MQRAERKRGMSNGWLMMRHLKNKPTPKNLLEAPDILVNGELAEKTEALMFLVCREKLRAE